MWKRLLAFQKLQQRTEKLEIFDELANQTLDHGNLQQIMTILGELSGPCFLKASKC